MTGKKKDTGAASGNVVDLGLIRRPAFKGSSTSFSDHLTFKNIVLGLGLATFLIFLGSVASARIAFLFAALLGLAGLMVFEMSSRRKWEGALLEQLERMGKDHERLVRETARNRNEVSALKKTLADAGALARSYGKPGTQKDGEPVEQRMIRAMANQLSKIGGPEETADAETIAENAFSPTDTAAFEKETPPETGPAAQTVGQRLSDEQVLQLVNAAVRQDRIDLFLQPIVALPQRKIRFYEMFSRIRIRPDVYLPAERYIELALEQDLVPVIDNLLLLRGLQMLRDTEEENFNRAFFCNITSLTLNDPKFMGDLVEFISQNRTLAPRLVFELAQGDLATMNRDTLPVLDGLSHIGCRFSMDQVRSLSFDFAHLDARYIRFIKVDAKTILQELRELGGLSRMKRLKSEMDAHGIDLIVEKVEQERQLVELLDVEIDYGQGFLFGKPALYQDT